MTREQVDWSVLENLLEGELKWDDTQRILYATDASVYRELPLAVAFPKSATDVANCIRFAGDFGISITPRAGGTSLAGQAVGSGLIVDVSKYLREILEINTAENYVIVQPGVIRDQLNAALAPLGYWFGPNTSTANRCTLGGMFGNNSCGSTSISAGSTRDHVLAARVVLADGSLAEVDDTGLRAIEPPASELVPACACVTPSDLPEKINGYLAELLGDPTTRAQIRAAFPKRSVSRRNTGYALDALLDQHPYAAEGPPQNLCALLAGSEGTLAFTTQLKLRILPLPPAGTALAALHFASIKGTMLAAQVAMKFQPFQCEVMDDTILNLARKNKAQAKNAAFVKGNPRGLLLVEFRAETAAQAFTRAEALATAVANDARFNASYTVTEILSGPAQTKQAWDLRKAGLGILGNMVGDAKAVACIEDTAVDIEDLADYIAEVEALMHLYQQEPVYYAHAGAGEIHLRPVLNLKRGKDREDFYKITRDVAHLVKKYRGSLSGEHGDGRVRAAFLQDMVGPEVYVMLVGLKRAFDPENRLNPGKIVEAPPMNESLRYAADQETPAFVTGLDWSADQGLLRAAEKCNGSGDCRKMSGGAMCPSFRETLDEQHSTRGRANALREVLTRDQRGNPFENPVLEEALDLCLSCKACTSECPSSVDMTNLKAEYQYQKNERSLRTRMVAANERLYRWGAKVPGPANWLLKATAPLVKRVVGIAPGRSLPAIANPTFGAWLGRPRAKSAGSKGSIYLFRDEFTDLQDSHVGIAAVTLLERLGYELCFAPDQAPSGRAQLSKGYLKEARKLAERNVSALAGVVTEQRPLVGLEPSAILGFRDEYPKLLKGELATQARKLAEYAFTLDEFLAREFERGSLTSADFGNAARQVVLHVHCHEKALGEAGNCALALSLPQHFSVTLLDSGCCGMAGSFGYEAEHFELSKRIAEQSLLHHLRGLPAGTLVVANGTSCRHQVKDLLQLRAVSTAEALLLSWEG